MEFEWGMDIYRARQVVMERLAVAQERLPDNVQPLLMPISSYMGEILLVAISGENADTVAFAYCYGYIRAVLQSIDALED